MITDYTIRGTHMHVTLTKYPAGFVHVSRYDEGALVSRRSYSGSDSLEWAALQAAQWCWGFQTIRSMEVCERGDDQ